MALNKKPTFPARGKMNVYGHQDVDAGGARTVIGADDNVQGCKVVAAFANGEDTNPRDVSLILYDGTNQHVLTTTTVPAGAGKDPAIPAVDLLEQIRDILPKDQDNQPYLYLNVGHELLTQPDASITSTEFLSTFAIFGTFDDEVA